VIVQVGEGLVAIHQAGVIHRDLKPANVMQDAQGVVRVMDFGIAKLGEPDSRDLTAEGKIVGSPEYMSPEQVKAIGVDFRSDLYSLGIVAFELFTGRVPFRSDAWLTTMRKQVDEAPPLDDPEVASRLPPGLVPVLRKALAKDPSERYATSGAMLAALKSAQADLERHPTDEVANDERSARPLTDRTTEASLLWPAAAGVWSYPAQARLLVPTLCRALKHPDRSVRLGAAEALGRTPDERARGALQEALGDEDRDVRVLANATLRKLVAMAEPDEPPAPSLAVGESLGDSVAARPVPTPVPALAPGPIEAPRDLSVADPPPEPVVVRPPAPVPARSAPEPKSRPRSWWIVAGLLAVAGLVWLYLASRPRSSAAPLPPPSATPLSPADVTAAPTAPPTAPPSEPLTTPPVPSPGLPRRTRTTVIAPSAAQSKSGEVTPPAAAPTVEPTPLPPPETSAATLAPVSPPSPAAALAPSTEPPAPRPEPPKRGDLIRGGDPGVTLPVCAKCPSPEYPEIARRFNRTGTVVLRALIDENGRVAEVTVVTAVEWLTDDAVRAVRRWTYRPAQKQGVAVKAWIELPVRFDLPK
jgi:serine/threonine-protein kinase